MRTPPSKKPRPWGEATPSDTRGETEPPPVQTVRVRGTWAECPRREEKWRRPGWL